MNLSIACPNASSAVLKWAIADIWLCPLSQNVGGVRRFGDFAAHLAIPRAVLTQRLATLAEAGVLEVVPGPHGHDEYALTGKGRDLWPVIRSLLVWGDEHYSEAGPRRVFRHAGDNGDVPPDGVCEACGDVVGAADLVVAPGPGLAAIPAKADVQAQAEFEKKNCSLAWTRPKPANGRSIS